MGDTQGQMEDRVALVQPRGTICSRGKVEHFPQPIHDRNKGWVLYRCPQDQQGTAHSAEEMGRQTHRQEVSQRQRDATGLLCSQHSMGTDAVCTEMTFPLPWGTCTLNTSRTRVFLRPMSVSPFRSSMSEFRSFRIPAQSMLKPKNGRQALPADARITLHPKS